MPTCRHCGGTNLEPAVPTNPLARILAEDKALFRCKDCDRWTAVKKGAD